MIGQIPKSPANLLFRMSGCDFDNPDILSEQSESKDVGT